MKEHRKWETQKNKKKRDIKKYLPKNKSDIYVLGVNGHQFNSYRLLFISSFESRFILAHSNFYISYPIDITVWAYTMKTYGPIPLIIVFGSIVRIIFSNSIIIWSCFNFCAKVFDNIFLFPKEQTKRNVIDFFLCHVVDLSGFKIIIFIPIMCAWANVCKIKSGQQ